MELEIVWQEHELGSYATIGLVWDDPMRGPPGITFPDVKQPLQPSRIAFRVDDAARDISA